jgi:hypothetical protein
MLSGKARGIIFTASTGEREYPIREICIGNADAQAVCKKHGIIY